MGIQQSNHKKPQMDQKPGKTKTATRKTIERLKDGYCLKLKGLAGELSNSEVTYEGSLKLYQKKKCSFIRTEKNYRITRNLSLSTGVELGQASEEIKSNVAAYIKYNGDDKGGLVKALKDALAAAKDAKTKFAALHDAAFKLSTSWNDRCNSGQRIILGCGKDEDCNDCNDNEKQPGSPGQKPQACENICEVVEELIAIPETLSNDIDIIFNSAAEIIGIQSFTNIKTLEKFQQEFYANAKAFNDQLDASIKTGAESVTAAQKALTDSIKTLTQSSFILYGKRNEVETADETKDYLCCHECNCLEDCGCNGEGNEGSDCDERLKKCKCEICDICKEVKDVYCEKEVVEESKYAE